jgi:murein DD-endopeptidase MepM/ murein hydrolase activator NlpD
LKHYNFGDGVGHIDALDLFTDEGSSVMAPIHSVVILAESTWRPNDVSSSVSDRGGNTVVLFDGQHFIRLAHLNTVGVVAGQVIAVGDMIGTVGHTGSNASLLGHGHHLHIEIHLLQNGTITQLSSAEIKQVLSEGKLK